MSEFTLQETELNQDSIPVGGNIFNNVKRLSSGDGSFLISEGKIELRDSDGNVVVKFDANG